MSRKLSFVVPEVPFRKPFSVESSYKSEPLKSLAEKKNTKIKLTITTIRTTKISNKTKA